MSDLSNETVRYIIARVVDNANDAITEVKENPTDPFLAGKLLAYYETLDTIKNELIAHEQDPSDFDLGIDLDKMMF